MQAMQSVICCQERAIRGHFLVDSTFNTMVLSKAFHVDVSGINLSQDLEASEEKNSTEQHCESANDKNESQDNHSQTGQLNLCHMEADIFKQLLEKLSNLYEDFTSSNLPITDVQTSPIILQYTDTFLDVKNSLQMSHNLKLWLRYMDMMDILLKAERTCHGKLHLEAIFTMRPYLATSGHNLCAKSVYLYIQDMIKLEELHPKVYNHFLQGYHEVHTSNHLWADCSILPLSKL